MRQSLEEIELAQMEKEQMEDVGGVNDDDDDEDKNDAHYDSPYPSDDEDEEEFVITSSITDSSIRSDNESIVLVSDLSNRLQDLPVGSLSPVVDRFETSTPTPPCHYDHCGCIACTICTDCGVCKFCLICFTCGDCHYETKSFKNSKLEIDNNNDKVPKKDDATVKISKNDDATVKKGMSMIDNSKNDDATVKEKIVDATVNPADQAKRVSELIGYKIDIPNKKLNSKELKHLRFCQRRISINNRRMDIQREYRTLGLIVQDGTVRLLEDEKFWACISMTGYADILIPRTSAHLIYTVNFCPSINWTVINIKGDLIDGLTEIGVFLREHMNKYNWVSIQPTRIGSIRRSTEPMGVPSKMVRIESPVDVSKSVPKPIPKSRSTIAPSILSPSGPKPNIPSGPKPNIQSGSSSFRTYSKGPELVVPAVKGFPSNAPVLVISPVFVWPQEYRNMGTPGERIRRFMARRLQEQNAQASQNSPNGSPRDRDNEAREMRQICS